MILSVDQYNRRPEPTFAVVLTERKGINYLAREGFTKQFPFCLYVRRDEGINHS